MELIFPSYKIKVFCYLTLPFIPGPQHKLSEALHHVHPDELNFQIRTVLLFFNILSLKDFPSSIVFSLPWNFFSSMKLFFPDQAFQSGSDDLSG